MLSDLWARITKNPGYKLLSIVLAFAAWVYVQGDTQQESKMRVPVVWSVPDGLATAEPLPRTAMLEVRGTRLAMRAAASAPVQVVLDVRELGIGAHALELDATLVQGLPPGVEALSVAPAAVRFVLDDVVTRRLPLVADRVGSPAPGFRVQQITVDPPVVEVRGPREVLKALQSVAIAPVDVSGMASDAIVDVEVAPPRAVEIEEVRARAAVQVVPELEQRVFTGVPVSVWRQVDWRPEVDMIEVTLEGPTALMRGMTTEQVVAFVHLPDRPTRARYEATFGPERGLRIRVLHPGGEEVRVVAMEPQQVPVVQR